MKGRDPFYSFDTLPQIQVANLFVEIYHSKLYNRLSQITKTLKVLLNLKHSK